MTRDRLIALLAKLDALAERPGTPEEGDAARKRAAMIREKHAAVLAAVPAQAAPLPFFAMFEGFTTTGGATFVGPNITIVFRP